VVEAVVGFVVSRKWGVLVSILRKWGN
jgi:hypothetical protein